MAGNNVALLNPVQDAELAKSILDTIGIHFKRLENKLLTERMDHLNYVATFEALQALKHIRVDAQSQYDSATRK